MKSRTIVIGPVVAGLFTLALAVGPGAVRPMSDPSPTYAPGEVLVKFIAGSGNGDRGLAMAALHATLLAEFRSGGQRWRLGPGIPVARAVEILRGNPRVEYVHPNYRIIPQTTVNDPGFSSQWYLTRIKADRAWDVTHGCGMSTPGCSRPIRVAVLDSGIVAHPDLEPNVDRALSYDYAEGDADASPACEFILSRDHGTEIAGVIGAVTDNAVGVAGINWNVDLIASKIFSPPHSANYISSAVAAVNDAVAHGVDVMNASWTIDVDDCGGTPCAPALYQAIQQAGLAVPGILFVAAAGNGSPGGDIDASPLYPASYNLDNVITVAGTDVNDVLEISSNYGHTSVDLAAPFTTYTTTPGPLTACDGPSDPNCDNFCFPLGPGGGPFWVGDPTYTTTNGTSFSAPQVAGVAALLRAVRPNATVAQIKSALLSSTDPLPSLQGKTVSGGRLNAFCALQTITQTYTGNPTVQVVWPNGGNALFIKTYVTLTWSATDDCGGIASIDIKLSRNGGATFTTIASSIPNTGSYTWYVSGPATTLAVLKVVARDAGSNSAEDLSNAAFTIKSGCGPCQTDYCAGEGSRCWWNNTCGVGGCCQYACQPDPTCTLPDPLPPNACGGA